MSVKTTDAAMVTEDVVIALNDLAGGLRGEPLGDEAWRRCRDAARDAWFVAAAECSRRELAARPLPDAHYDPFAELARVFFSAGVYRRRMSKLTYSDGVYGVTAHLGVRWAASEAALLLKTALGRAEETERIGRETGRIR